MNLDWILGRKKELEDLRRSVDKINNITYVDIQKHPVKSIYTGNLTQYLTDILNGKIINEEDAEELFEQFL